MEDLSSKSVCDQVHRLKALRVFPDLQALLLDTYFVSRQLLLDEVELFFPLLTEVFLGLWDNPPNRDTC